MPGRIIFSDRPLEELELDPQVEKILKRSHLETIGDVQQAILNGETPHLIGPRRTQYIRNELSNRGLIAIRPWTDRVYKSLFGEGEDNYDVISTRGEKELANKLLYWLHDAKIVPHPENVDPAFVFFGRMGIGRIRRSVPDHFNDYEGYELIKNKYGRYDDFVQSSGQLARICNVEVGAVNTVYQNCLRLLRSDECRPIIMAIYRDYAEERH